MTAPTSISIPKLRADVRGQVIGPDDAEYDRARAVFYGGFDLYPAVIVRVADEMDVARVIALARETGLELAVRSGGHDVIGQGVSDGGIVIDLADLRLIEVDPEDADGVGPDRPDRGRVHERHPRPRAGGRVQQHGFGRDRGDHARRRRRVPRPQARPHDRQPAGRRDRDRRRRARPR